MASTAALELLIQLRDQASQELAQLQGGLKGIGEEANKAQGHGESFFSRMASVAGGFLAANVFGRITSGISDFAGGMVSGNAEFETYLTQFGVLLGSADAAKGRLDELAKFGASTPFDLPELVRADKILTSFGLDSKDTAAKFGVSAAQIRTTVGDVASGVGLGFEEMSGLMGRFSSGATGEAISRFQELGITTREEMAGWGIQFSKSGEMLTPTKEAFSVLESHLRQKFGGMMDAQSRTFDGMKSNLQDWVGNAQRTIGAPIFEVVKDKLSDLLAFLGRPETQKAIQGFAEALAQGIGKAIDWLTTTGIPLFQQGIQIVGQVIETVRPYIEALVGAIQGLGQGNSEAAGFIGEAWARIRTALLLAVDLLNASVVPAFQALARFLGQHGQEITQIFSGAWEIIENVFRLAMDIITGIIRVAIDLFKGDWKALGADLSLLITSIWTDIQAIIHGALTELQGYIGLALAAVGTNWETAWAAILGFLQGLPAGFLAAATGVGNAIRDGIVGGIRGTIGVIGNLADQLLGALKSLINSAIDAINDAIPNDLGFDLLGKWVGIDLPDNPLPHLSTGQMLVPGGFFLAGEYGPELVYAGAGGRAYSNSETRALGGDTLVFNFPSGAASYSDEARVKGWVRAGLAEAGRAADSRGRMR